MSNLFKSKKQREREARRERRKAFRQAEDAIDEVRGRLKLIEKEATVQWEQAREALLSGEKEKARRLMQGYRAAQVLATRLEQKRWLFEQTLQRMENARTDQEFTAALAAVNKVTEVNPEKLAEVFSGASTLTSEQERAETTWESLYKKETGRASTDLEGSIPPIEELLATAEAEAATEDAPSTPNVEATLEQARRRIEELAKPEEPER